MVATKHRIASRFEKSNNLDDWIRKIKNKKFMVKRETRGQDLRVLAMLTEALSHAEECQRREKIRKQEDRAIKWARIRSRLAEPPRMYCDLEEEEEDEKSCKASDAIWSEDFNGINTFITELSSIKTPISR
ncbi:uncharacterized protein LOC131686840 [Topomyia yanbarensis]|uniref:uncharacterized protein LOC131686840 n=1 Tax=Topomyia yanbarensis TaxID=2498891 RepID=UPI00273CD399|nr:uncharacterized protein LOC131686840 [Topomyia yanbarensis]